MKTVRPLLVVLLLLAPIAPARADFQYTETSQVTGGALIGMVKFASVFARGDAKKQEKQKPCSRPPQRTTSRATVCAPITRTAPRRSSTSKAAASSLSTSKTKTYAVATFDQIKAAMEQAQQQMQQQMQQATQQNPQQKQQMQNAQITDHTHHPRYSRHGQPRHPEPAHERNQSPDGSRHASHGHRPQRAAARPAQLRHRDLLHEHGHVRGPRRHRISGVRGVLPSHGARSELDEAPGDERQNRSPRRSKACPICSRIQRPSRDFRCSLMSA